MKPENIQDTPGPEVKYAPGFYVNDLAAINSQLLEKLRIVGQIEFSDAHKAQIAGTLMLMGATMTGFLAKLKQWGFIT